MILCSTDVEIQIEIYVTTLFRGAMTFHSRGTISRTRRIPTRVQANLSFINERRRRKRKKKDTHLYEKPRCNKGQAAVLSIKSVVVRVEGEVIEVEKSETKTTISSIKRRRAVIVYFLQHNTVLYLAAAMLFNRLHNSPIFTMYTGTRATTLYRSDRICLLKCQDGRVTCDVVSVWLGNYSFIKYGKLHLFVRS